MRLWVGGVALFIYIYISFPSHTMCLFNSRNLAFFWRLKELSDCHLTPIARHVSSSKLMPCTRVTHNSQLSHFSVLHHNSLTYKKKKKRTCIFFGFFHNFVLFIFFACAYFALLVVKPWNVIIKSIFQVSSHIRVSDGDMRSAWGRWHRLQGSEARKASSCCM